MIKLLELTLINFLSHKNSSLNLTDYTGLVLIEGRTCDGHYSSNGAGKSTILEGIIYALTGDTLRGISVNDVVNRNAKKDTEVTLKFMKSDIIYTVSRYRKHHTHGDSLVLYKEGENISKRVNKETQKLLEDILGISYKVLISTMLLGEGLSSRFTQLSDPEKKSLIESTLNMNYDMNSLRSKVSVEQQRLKLEEERIQGQLSILREFSNLDVKASEESLKSFVEEEAKASKRMMECKAQLTDLQGSRGDLTSKIQLIQSSIYKLESLSREFDAKSKELVSYDEALLHVQNDSSPVCPLCQQSLHTDSSLNSVTSSYKMKRDTLKAEMSVIADTISGLPSIELLRMKFQELNTQLNSLDHRIADCNEELNNWNSRIIDLQYQQKNLQDKITQQGTSTEKIAELEEEESNIASDIRMYEYYYKLFSPTGIIVNIISEAIAYINERLSIYSEVLLEKDYRLHSLQGKIILRDSKGSSYQSLSNGEKRRLDISIQFALHDYVHTYCGLKMDTLFIDEILDTLDDIGVDNIFEVLRMKLSYCNLHSAFIITHNDSLKNKFDRVITVSKDIEGNSRLD